MFLHLVAQLQVAGDVRLQKGATSYEGRVDILVEDGRVFVTMLGTLKTLMSFADSWGMAMLSLLQPIPTL